MTEKIFEGLGLVTDPTKVRQPTIASKGAVERATEKAQQDINTVGFLGGAWIGQKEGIAPTALNYIDRRWSASEPMEKITDEQRKFLIGDLTDPRAYERVLEEARDHGMERATLMRDNFLSQQKNMEQVAASGWTGVAGLAFSQMFDAGEWAAIAGTTALATSVGTPVAGMGVFAAGAANRAKKAYSTARLATRGAAVGAIEASAFEAIRAEQRYDTDINDIFIAMGLGASIGGSVGAAANVIQRRAAVSRLAYRISQGESLDNFTETEKFLYNNYNVDATAIRMINERADEIANDVPISTTPKSFKDMTQEELDAAPKVQTFDSVTTKLRRLVSSGTRTMTSKLGAIRDLGGRLSANSAGYQLDANGNRIASGQSASEIQELIQLKFKNPYTILQRKTFNAWKKRTGGTFEQFNVAVSRTARGIVDDADPEVKELAALVTKQERDLYQMGIDADAAGFTQETLDKTTKQITPDYELTMVHYLPRIFNANRIRDIRSRLGNNADLVLTRLVKQALLDEQPDILKDLMASLQKKTKDKKKKYTLEDAEKKLDSMAEGYMKTITSPKLISSPRGGAEFDLEDLEKLLLERGHITSEVEAILDVMTFKNPVKGIKRTKPRLILNEGASVDVENPDGSFSKVFFHELLEEDIEQLHQAYIFQVSGAIALARKGIDTNQAGTAFSDYLETVKENIRKKNLNEDDHASEISALQFMYDGITGNLAKNQEVNNNTREFLIAARAFSFAASMGMSGMSALMELTNAVFESAVMVNLKTIPQLGRIINLVKSGNGDDVMDELIAAFGFGEEVALGRFNNANRFDGSNVEGSIAPATQGIYKFAGVAQQKVSYWSGLQGVTQTLRRLSMMNYANSWGTALQKGKLPFHPAKLSQLGITPEMAGKILKNMEENSTIVKGKVKKLNLKEWDADAREVFEASGFKDTRQNVQEMNIGSTNRFMRSEVGKTALQFLSFPLAALEQQAARQATRGLQGDGLGVGKVLLSASFMGTLMYIARVHMNAQGRSDKEAYLKRNLAPSAIAGGALGQVGAFSTFHMIYTMTTGGSGGNAFAITPPALGMLGNAQSFLSDVADLDPSEASVRAGLRIIPGQSLYLANQSLNAISAELTN